MTNGNCQTCGNPMWAEGVIHDDIPLCHACYGNQTAKAVITCGDCLRPDCKGCEY